MDAGLGASEVLALVSTLIAIGIWPQDDADVFAYYHDVLPPDHPIWSKAMPRAKRSTPMSSTNCTRSGRRNKGARRIAGAYRVQRMGGDTLIARAANPRDHRR